MWCSATEPQEVLKVKLKEQTGETERSKGLGKTHSHKGSADMCLWGYGSSKMNLLIKELEDAINPRDLRIFRRKEILLHTL